MKGVGATTAMDSLILSFMWRLEGAASQLGSHTEHRQPAIVPSCVPLFRGQPMCRAYTG